MIGAVGLAIAAAILFGAATPASKILLGRLHPFQLAGLLYLGAAIAVAPVAARRGGLRWPDRRDRRNRLRLLGAVIAGGVCGPVLLLLGLRMATASSVSLWLNFELMATAVLGVLVFRDHLGAFGWTAVVCAIGGALLLCLPGGTSDFAPAGLVLLACFCWGLDNHLTALIDGITPSQSTFWKGLVAGAASLAIGFSLFPSEARACDFLGALFVGAWAYGASIALYIASAHRIGATRAQIAFASAPFFGVALSLLVLREPLGVAHVASAILFLAGVGLLVADRHEHGHAHEPMEHEHAHRHDDGHHDHDHAGLSRGTWHAHRHAHGAVEHAHAHVPDLHHRHGHPNSREGNRESDL